MAFSVALSRRATLGSAGGRVSLVAAAGMYLVATARSGGLELGYPVAAGARRSRTAQSWSILTGRQQAAARRRITGRVELPVDGGRHGDGVALAARCDLVADESPRWRGMGRVALPGSSVCGARLCHLDLAPAPSAGQYRRVHGFPQSALDDPLQMAARPCCSPQLFTFTVLPREWLGGLVTLVGMGIALAGPARSLGPIETSGSD